MPPSGSSLRVDSARIAANPPTSGSKMPGLRAAGDHHVGVTAADDLRRFAERVAARGAGRHGREVRPGHPELDGDLAGPDVGDAHRDEERADPVGAAQGVGRDAFARASRRRRARCRGSPRSARRARPRVAPAAPPGPSPRAPRRGRTGCSGPSAGAPCGRGRALDRSRAPRRAIRDGQSRRVERLDRADARPSRDQAVPGRGDVVAEGRDGTHPGHDDATASLLGHRTSFPVRTVAAR